MQQLGLAPPHCKRDRPIFLFQATQQEFFEKILWERKQIFAAIPQNFLLLLIIYVERGGGGVRSTDCDMVLLWGHGCPSDSRTVVRIL